MGFITDLCKVVNLFTDSVPQDDQHRHSHLHVTLLCIIAQHLPHNGAEEAGGQMWAEQRLGDGDEREGLNGCQTSDLGLVAADVRGVGLVLLEVFGGRRVVHDLVTQLEGLPRQSVLLLLYCNKRCRFGWLAAQTWIMNG